MRLKSHSRYILSMISMSIKKTILSLFVIFLVLATGCSKNALLDEHNSKLLNYDFNIADLKNIDKTLINQKYSYSTSIDKNYIAIITYQSKKATIKQYLINKDGTLDFTVPKGSPFIISLPANRTITYTWNIKNNLENGIIKLENRSRIDIPSPKSEFGKDGAGYDRQNFYLKTLKSGNEKLVMRYEHEKEQRNEFFEITLNVKIEE